MEYSSIDQRIFNEVIDITARLFLLSPEQQEAVAKALENPRLASEMLCRETLKGFAAVIRNHTEED